MIEELVARVFTTRNLVHLEHWSTDSYAVHVALGEFYDILVGKIDGIVETYQGAFRKLEVPLLPMAKKPANIIKYLEADVKWISDHRSEISKGLTCLENLVDGITEAYFVTIYKLKGLS